MARDGDHRRRGARRTPLPDPVNQQEDPPQQQLEDFPFILEQYTADCFVDTDVMLANYASLAKGHFTDDAGREVSVHIPTSAFFALHTLDANAPRIWSSLCLEGYFALQAWGPDFRRAWQVLCTLTDRHTCMVVDFEGNMREITLDRPLIRRALNLTAGELQYNDKAHTSEDRDRCSDAEHPTWDELKCQEIRLALQLHTQHFQITNPHRWSQPSKGVAIEYTNRQVLNTPLNTDYVGMWIWNLHRAAKSNITLAKTKAKRPQRPYLGAVLALTRIVYCALDRLDQLPPPWTMPDAASIESKVLVDPHKKDKKKLAQEKRKRKREAFEASLPQRSPRKTRAHTKKKSSDEESEQPPNGHHSDSEEDLLKNLGDYGTTSDLPTGPPKAVIDDALLQRMFELQIPADYGSFLTETEAEIIRDITISISQDSNLVVKLRQAAQVMSEERRKKQEKEATRQEAARMAAREKAKTALEAEMKKKGKGKLYEGEGSTQQPHPEKIVPTTSFPSQIPRATIMAELKEALERESAPKDFAPTGDAPLEGILESFITFYRELKQRSQLLAENKEKQEQEVRQLKEQAQSANEKNEELQQSLDQALKDKKVYMEELEFALNSNISYAAERQAEVDALNMKLRRLQRKFDQADSEQIVLRSALSFANDKMDEARKELTGERQATTQLISEKLALETDLQSRQSFMMELQGRVERLTTDLEVAQNSLDSVWVELETLEQAKKTAEETLREALEETTRTE